MWSFNNAFRNLAKTNKISVYRRWMSGCCQGYEEIGGTGSETRFSMRSNNFKFGPGVIEEVGQDARGFATESKSRVALIVDPHLVDYECTHTIKQSLRDAGCEAVVYSDINIEPTQKTFEKCALFMKENGPFSTVVSLGGGSTIDTAKAGILYSCSPPPTGHGFLYYVNAPVGDGAPLPPPNELIPHIAIPTTAGTGSEATGISIFSLKNEKGLNSKTGIASPSLIPQLALIDPLLVETLPSTVVAASGFDVLCHAVESFTSKPYTFKKATGSNIRPLSQGRNPYSDMACREALRLCGLYFKRAITDPSDKDARHNMMWASTIVGSAMGNAGVHLPHGLSYPVAGNVKTFAPKQHYGRKPIVPHGMAVAICAPSVFKAMANTSYERHMEVCNLILADTKIAKMDDSGEVLAEEIVSLLKLSEFPDGLETLGFSQDDLKPLATACFQQKRIVDNAPADVTEEEIYSMYKDAFKLW